MVITVKGDIKLKVKVPVRAASSLTVDAAHIKQVYETKLQALFSKYQPKVLPEKYSINQNPIIASAGFVARTIHTAGNWELPKDRLEHAKLRKSIVTREEIELLDWARRKNLFQETSWFTQEWHKQSNIAGSEQQVIINKDINTVTKRKMLLPDETWLDYFNRLSVHNKISPSTAYDFKGFTQVENNAKQSVTMAMVTQPYVVGRGALSHEIEAFMYGLGFEKLPFTKFNISNKDGLPPSLQEWIDVKTGIVLSDLHAQNVLVTPEGAMAMIDPLIDVLDPQQLKDAKASLENTQYQLSLASYDSINDAYISYGFVIQFGAELRSIGVNTEELGSKESVSLSYQQYKEIWPKLQQRLKYLNMDKFSKDPKDNLYHIMVNQVKVSNENQA